MKNLKLFVPLLLCLFSLMAFAQGDVASKTDWKIFQPKGEEYSLETPTAFELVSYDEQESSQEFLAELNGRFFFVSSESINSKLPDINIENFLTIAAAKPINAKISGLNAKTYFFKFSDNYFHKFLAVVTKNRKYFFHTASEIQNDEMVDKFFKSIKLDRKLIGDNALIKEKAKSEQGIGTSGSNDSGNYGVNSPGSGSGNGIAPTTTDANNSPLRILSKPRANYTDFARSFSIQGRVTLKVVFLSTGEIGNIEPVKRLPFGLTENAVQAARKMRFEPMKKDGSPANIIKQVQYSFTIY